MKKYTQHEQLIKCKPDALKTKHLGFNCKLKPISLVLFSLFASQAFAQTLAEESQPNSEKVAAAEQTNIEQSKIEQQNTAKAASKLPSTTDNYNIKKETLLAAEASDAKLSDEPNKVNSPNKDKAIVNAPNKADKNAIELQKINVRAKRFHEIGPLPGLGLTKEEIPGNVQSITAKEIKESHSLSITDLMNKKLQSVNVNDYQGNPFMMDITYRGFTAGPQIGTPQGLSVFFDGIRVNEPFGDVVNWDMIPMNAIAGVDVFPGSNPIFGLNTLGGAFTLKTKDGFNNEGVDAEILAGSYGRKQLQVSGGINNGTFALFGAGNFFLEDGWRDDSPSKVNQFFGKGSYRGEKLDLSLSTLLVKTDLVGNGLLPSEMYAQDRESVFTSPDTTKNRLAQFQLSGAFQVNDNFSITGQAYRRNSKRHAVGADAFTDYSDKAVEVEQPPINPATGLPEQYTSLFNSTGEAAKHGLPDYVVMTIDNYDPSNPDKDFFNQPLALSGFTDISGPEFTKNAPLPEGVINAFKYRILEGRSPREFFYNRTAFNNPTNLSGGEPSADNFFEGGYYSPFGDLSNTVSGGLPVLPIGATGTDFFYTKTKNPDGTDNIQKNFVMILPAINDAEATIAQSRPNFEGIPYTTLNKDGINLNNLDGFWGVVDDGFGNAAQQSGVVKGTPTAVFNDNNINQTVDGASIQLNWNFEHHKFMIGASIDAAEATYSNTSQLGFLDANRKAFLAPDLANPLLAGADMALSNNDFSGTNTTKSIYFSETWTPVEAWHFNASARYNETKTKNKIAARYGFGVFGVGDIFNMPYEFDVCPNGDCTNVPTGFRRLKLSNVLDPAETEKFSYYSLNPSLGATWQAQENLNLFANVAQGTRTPSVIELGCALDKTLVLTDPPNDADGDGIFTPAIYSYKSIAENRQCTLPTTLSGDPYLEQIKATTYDIGARGTLNNWLGTENIQWNLGAYQTDLKDDIYFITVGNGQGFFDNIGKTRRRGLEAGLSGRKDKLSFSLNYGLTDATFQDKFLMMSEDNSSAFEMNGFGDENGVPLKLIEVKKGNRMPGVPLHNLNATVSYDITPKWTIGLTAVAHSESFVRGNENNKHKVGVIQYVTYTEVDGTTRKIAKQPTTNPGKVPGYATFNFQTSYKFNNEWTANLLVNNLFDKEFFSAGRLGRNPFSPSVFGAIGPDGYNHNSGDWRSTNFIAPSAPRGIWFSLNWQFDGKK